MKASCHILLRLLLIATLFVMGCRKKIHEAVYTCSYSEIEQMIKKGADINEQNARLRTPLHNAALSGRLDVVNLLLDHSASIDIVDDSNWTPLLAACANSKISGDVIPLLVEHRADVNVKCKNGMGVLHYAAYTGNSGSVRFFIEMELDVNDKDSNGYTPLYWAIFSGHEEVVEVLIGVGCDLNYSDSVYKLALTHALAGRKENIAKSIVAAMNLEEYNSNGLLPLHIYVIKGNYKAVKMLIEQGSPINVKAKECGRTALDLALSDQPDKPELAELLKKHGACKSGDLNELSRP